MRIFVALAFLALGTSGCDDRNLVGEKSWSDEQLGLSEMGFGWNYVVEDEEAASRFVDIAIHSDNSFDIEIGEYHFEGEPRILGRASGTLTDAMAIQLRRKLDQLRSGDYSALYTTMPNCPISSHPDIEFYVGFEADERQALTILERNCDSPETQRGREIAAGIMAAFPQVDHAKLMAGSVEL